jgi:hypothetical protein
MQHHSFSKRRLALGLMSDKEKNAALSDKNKQMWVKKCFRSRKSGQYCTVYKELAEHQFQYLLHKIRMI